MKDKTQGIYTLYTYGTIKGSTEDEAGSQSAIVASGHELDYLSTAMA
jgi:hypothetical protein